jgi:hypothetical protein
MSKATEQKNPSYRRDAIYSLQSLGDNLDKIAGNKNLIISNPSELGNLVDDQMVCFLAKKGLKIKELYLPNSIITNQAIDYFKQMPDLSILDLESCHQLTDNGLAQLIANHPHLIALDIFNCSTGPKTLEALAQSNLTILKFGCLKQGEEIIEGKETIRVRARELINLMKIPLPQTSPQEAQAEKINPQRQSLNNHLL